MRNNENKSTQYIPDITPKSSTNESLCHLLPLPTRLFNESMCDIAMKSSKERGKLFKVDHTVSLTPGEEATYAALKKMGYKDSHMLTLAAPLKGYRVNEDWFRKAIHTMMRDYFRQYGEHPQWMVVINRGWSGKGEWSAHIVWKNERPRKMKFFLSWWNKRFGSERAMLSTHTQCLRYVVKNMGQPDARTHDGVHNRRSEPKKGKGFRVKAEE